MKIIGQTIDRTIEPLRRFSDFAAAPLFDLAARLYLAHDFFRSGLTRWKDFINGNFDNQIFLFELEHPVPGLSPELAAYASLAGELILPILLALGLFGRVAAAGLLIMALIIEFTYLHSVQHILWMFLAAMILIKGPGRFSLDTLLLKFIRKA